MENVLDPVTVDLGDGVERPLRLTIGGFKRLRKAVPELVDGTGEDATEEDKKARGLAIMDGLVPILKEMLPADSGISEAFIDDLPISMLIPLSEKVTQAISQAFPDATKNAQAGPVLVN